MSIERPTCVDTIHWGTVAVQAMRDETGRCRLHTCPNTVISQPCKDGTLSPQYLTPEDLKNPEEYDKILSQLPHPFSAFLDGGGRVLCVEDRVRVAEKPAFGTVRRLLEVGHPDLKDNRFSSVEVEFDNGEISIYSSRTVNKTKI